MKEELPEVSIEILNSEELQENYNLRVENERLRAELEGAELVNEELEKQLAECSRDYHELRSTLKAQVRRYANKSGRLKAENRKLRAALEQIANFLPDCFDDVEAQHFAESAPKIAKQALLQTKSEGEG